MSDSSQIFPLKTITDFSKKNELSIRLTTFQTCIQRNKVMTEYLLLRKKFPSLNWYILRLITISKALGCPSNSLNLFQLIDSKKWNQNTIVIWNTVGVNTELVFNFNKQ